MKHLWLSSIMILAILLRFWGLGHFPPSLYWEEVALGYDAYSIWQTGRDHHGNAWPLVAFTSFGDYKPSGYFYIAAPFVGIFGLNDWSIRLPSAIAGAATVYLIYLLGRSVFRSEQIGLASAFSLAVMPWHVHFSRAAFEVNVATFLLVLGVFWLRKSSRKGWLGIFGTISLILAAYTYHGLRVLSPLILFINGCQVLLSKKNWEWWIASTGFALVLFLPILLAINRVEVRQRFNETSLFAHSNAVLTTNHLRTEDGNGLLARIIHHRYWYWGGEILDGMVSHVSPNFLFLEGDGNPRHQTGNQGLLFWWMLPLLVAGITQLLYKKKGYWIIGWIIIATLPPALTNTTPHTLRFLPAAPAFALLIGYGITVVFQHFRFSRIMPLSLITLALIEGAFYQYDYTHNYVYRSAIHWQYGYKELVQYLQQPEFKEVPIYVTRDFGRPAMYFLYYTMYDPKRIQGVIPAAEKDQGEILAYDQYHFTNTHEPQKSLLVSTQENSDLTLLHRIQLPDGKTAFYIYDTR
jgi:4-amino-4-deoxy-L-arabinose transferase-like glycosyltransferase